MEERKAEQASVRNQKPVPLIDDYLGKGSQLVCHTQPALKRYGIAELAEWVNMPLEDNIRCIDMNERKIITDETVRQMILKKCGADNISGFQLYSRERQKDIVREVMIELGAGPRQISRVSNATKGIYIVNGKKVVVK